MAKEEAVISRVQERALLNEMFSRVRYDSNYRANEVPPIDPDPDDDNE